LFHQKLTADIPALLVFPQLRAFIRGVNTPSSQVPVEVHFKPNGIGLIETHHEVDFFMEWRSDGFPKILFVIEGTGALHYAGGRIALRAHSVCIVPARLRHRLEDDRGQPMSLYGICLALPRFADHQLMRSVFRTLAVHFPMPQRILSYIRGCHALFRSKV